MRAYKTVNDTYIEPISFTVPRRAETFQSDIFPPATGLKPGVSAKEWFDGKTALPPKIDLESVYEGNAPVEVPADYKPPSAVSTPPTSAKPVQKEFEAPKPAQREPEAPKPSPPSSSDQKASISAMANKYKEQEESSEDEGESSSFEEISRPAPRGPPRQETKPAPRVTAPPTATKPAPAIRPTPAAAPAPAVAAAPSGRNSAEVSTSLREIKEMMQAQQGLLKAQSEQIGQLTQEVETLRRRVGSGGAEQSERIRQLELELEAARS